MANSSHTKDKNRKPDSNSLLEAQGRIPPQAVEIEEAILGSMLIEEQAASTALEILQVDDFYKPAHRHIFEVLTKLFERNNPLDILTVENELRDRDLLETVGGSGYLSDLTRAVSSAANIEYHCQIVAEKALKRNLILSCSDIIQDAYDSASDSFEVLDQAEQRIYEITNARARGGGQALGEILKNTLSYLEEIRGKKLGITGVPTGLDVDHLTAGWQRGDLIIVAARPSMGKTAFTLTVARNASLNQDPEKRAPVALFSLEMSDQALVQRLLTMEARVDAQKARTGKLDDTEFKQLIEGAGRLHTAPIFIDDTPSISIMEMRSKCRRLKNEHDIGLVVVDYLQLMTGQHNDRQNREQEIAGISRGLKALAKELDVPVIALSQLSRAVEQRGGDKRPQLSDLRESGSIEQDADVVCFLYRPEYYKITTDEQGNSTEGVAELIVGKQRNGPVGTVNLHFVKNYARFENLSRTYDDVPYLDSGDGAAHDALPDKAGSQDKNIEKRAKKTGFTAPPDDEDSPF
ncbi:replicative DNA helicase [Balneolales bacterium ANBcel1]|nr:replicative DNA helicase [Balneolales bacterium ANBcel1]